MKLHFGKYTLTITFEADEFAARRHLAKRVDRLCDGSGSIKIQRVKALRTMINDPELPKGLVVTYQSSVPMIEGRTVVGLKEAKDWVELAYEDSGSGVIKCT